MRPNIIAAVFARGGSKGVPRKNVRRVAGKPLIAYAIETAKAVSRIDRILVSTDDVEIAEAGRQAGAEIPFMRPAELATDTAAEWLSWQHLLNWIHQEPGNRRADVMVSLPTTSPMRSPVDVNACLDALLDSDADAVITVTPAARSPYFNMVTMDEEGYARVALAGGPVFTRQAAPVMYDITTVAYAARADYVLASSSLFAGRVKAVLVPQERALDIDSMYDLEIAEFLLSKRHTVAPS